MVGEIFGVDFKGKADLISKDIILDLKRSGDVKNFPKKVKYESSYDTQAFIYSTLLGLPFVFLVIGDKKKTYAVRCFLHMPSDLKERYKNISDTLHKGELKM